MSRFNSNVIGYRCSKGGHTGGNARSIGEKEGDGGR